VRLPRALAVHVPLALALLAPLLAGCTSSSADDATARDGHGMGMDMAEPESDIVTGTLTALATSVDLPIPLKHSGHERLSVALSMAQPVPDSRLKFSVNGPGGESAGGATAPFLYVFPGTRPTVAFDHPVAGDWTVRVELSGATADYVVHWCADDAAMPGPASNDACHMG
jgi:hypothetical protein